MNRNDLKNRLSEKQKERLRNANSQEDLDRLFTPNKMLLTEDQLGMVAGGSCYLPECAICGCVIGEHGFCKNGHIMGEEVQRPLVMCPSCKEFYPQGSEHTCYSDAELF